MFFRTKTKIDRRLKIERSGIYLISLFLISSCLCFGRKNFELLSYSSFIFWGSRNTLFILGKPIRWGYKTWVASERLGCVYHIDMDRGKNECHLCYREPFGFGDAVVINLIDKCETICQNMWFSLYFDNYFTSINLLEEITRIGHEDTSFEQNWEMSLHKRKNIW